MSKDKISDYSATANSNTDIGGINIDEGCAPSGINDAIRTLMKQLKDWQSGSQDVYIMPAGTASAPAVTTTGDPNTGIFFPAADTVGITTGGTERARVDSSGNVGIGTSSPTTKLQSDGTGGAPNATAATTATNASFSISSVNGLGTGTRLFGGVGSSAYTWLQAQNTSDGTFKDIVLNQLGGNVGIGTSSPSAQLHIVGSDTTDQVIIENTDESASSAPELVFYRNSASPAANDLLGNIVFRGKDSAGNTNAYGYIYAKIVNPTIGSEESALFFETTVAGISTISMAIDSGNVGIGIATPSTLLDIAASNTGLTSTTANNTLRFTDTDTSTGANQPIGKVEFYSADATTSARVGAYILATAQGTSGGGNLEFGTATNTGTVTEQMQITGAGDLQFNSGYGSVATAYGCRAWVNFNGTGTVAINASGNVSSITDNGTGDYTMNFTTAMPDANYSVAGTSYTTGNAAIGGVTGGTNYSFAASSLRFFTRSTSSTYDPTVVCISIFR